MGACTTKAQTQCQPLYPIIEGGPWYPEEAAAAFMLAWIKGANLSYLL